MKTARVLSILAVAVVSSPLCFAQGAPTSPMNAKAGVWREGFLWVLDVNGDGQFVAPPDRGYAFGGITGDIPLTGVWQGNVSSVYASAGIFRPVNGLFILDTANNGTAGTVYSFMSQQAGDIPVVGDWSGSGTSKIGIVRQGFLWLLDSNGDGQFDAGDAAFAYGGIAGDVPVAGDWTGSGRTNVGVFRQGFLWVLDASGDQVIDAGDLGFAFGGITGDIPVVGKWNPELNVPPSTPNTLSVTCSGVSCGSTTPGSTSQFTFTYNDPVNGSNNIQYGQVWLADSAGGVHCQSEWGNNGALDLFDGNPSSASSPNTTLSDSFCSISLASVTEVSTTALAVTLNMNFLPGAAGTYNVVSVVYDLDGDASTFGTLGTFTVTAPPPAYTITGQVTGGGAGISGITVVATSGGTQVASTVTGLNGYYLLVLPSGASYLIAALETDSWVFSPASIAFNALNAPGTAFFIGTAKYTISGNLTLLQNIPMGGMTVSLTGYQNKTATTDDSGNFSFKVPSGQNYTVSPPTFPFTFSAPVSFNPLSANQTANFTTTYHQCLVSPPTSSAAGGVLVSPWAAGLQALPNVIQVYPSGFPNSFGSTPSSTVITNVMSNWNAVLAYNFPCAWVEFATPLGAPGNGSVIDMQFVAFAPVTGNTLTRGLTNLTPPSATYINGRLSFVASMKINNQITSPDAAGEVIAHEFGHTFGLGDCDAKQMAICVLHASTMVINATDPNNGTINQLIGLPAPTDCDMATISNSGLAPDYSCPVARNRYRQERSWGESAALRKPSAKIAAPKAKASGGGAPALEGTLVGYRIGGGTKIWRHQASTLVVLGPERCPDNPRMALDYVRRMIANLAGNPTVVTASQAARSPARDEGVRLGGVVSSGSLGLHLPSGPGLLLVDRQGRIQNAWIGGVPIENFQEAAMVIREASDKANNVVYVEQEKER